MYKMDVCYSQAVAALLFAFALFTGAMAAPCPNCSKWEGQSFHNAQATRGGRCKTGSIPKGCIPTLNKSEDYCLNCQVKVGYNTPSGYRRCPKCFGRGEVADKIVNQKEETPATAPEESDSVQMEKAEKPSIAPTVVLVGVKSCDKCDDKGKVMPTINCSLCDTGYNHRKDGATYKCRICGKTCASRFAPCCKTDCPECGNKHDIKVDCSFCGGDKVITPLEEAKNKERMALPDAKQ